MDPQRNSAQHAGQEPSEKQRLALQAYHDGELKGFARWRFERALRRSPALQRELEQLQKLSGWMDELESGSPAESVSDLWTEIGPALSRIDAEVGPAKERTQRDAWSWGSLAATGAVAAAALMLLVLDNGGGITEDPVTIAAADAGRGSLRYLKTEGVSYVVSQESEDVTIIWLMDDATGGGA